MKYLLLWVGLPIVLSFGFAALLFALVFLNAAHKQKAMANGLPAVGIVQALQQTTGRQAGMPIVDVTLNVTPQNGPAFQAVAQQVISPANSYLFTPGSKVPVRYLPGDPPKVSIMIPGPQ